MCGIAGIFSLRSEAIDHIHSIIKPLSHRGPDALGIFVDPSKRIALGHTRLSIIDLNTNANQPMYSNDGRFIIAFNGEVYNYKKVKEELITKHGKQFRTNSDTEVIVESFSQWGEHMVNKLEGMFAIAIVDQIEQKLFLFRDRIGKKPLFYYQSEGIFIFASEIKAILKYKSVRKNVTINLDILPTFLHLGYIPEPSTIFNEIFKFPAGHTAVIGSDLKLKITPYWRIQDKVDTMRIKSVDVAKRNLCVLLNVAVQERLISDVPLGAFLSGGIDSSLITSIAAKQVSSPLKTFSIGFKDSKFNESHYAAEVAKHLNTDHIGYILAETEAIEILHKYLDHFDEPFADTSAIPTMLVSRLAREHVTVALTGDGGDELFQGYGAYTWANRLNGIAMRILRQPLIKILRATGKSRFERIAHLLQRVKIGSIRSHIFSQEQYFFSQQEIFQYLLLEKKFFCPFEYDESIFEDKNFTSGEMQALFDLQYYLKDDLLVKVDRASMYYALECRSPFLDHKIIEFAFSLDHSLKVKEGKTKWIVKELLREQLPSSLVDRQKWGFSVPLANWLKNDLHHLIDHYLNREVIEELGLVNENYVGQLKTMFFNGKDYLYNRIWVLIVLHKWLKENQ